MKTKIPMLLLSLAIAVGMWIYVVTYISPEDERTFSNVPVALENQSVLENKGLMLLSTGEGSVTLQLHGSRADLNSLTAGNILVAVDLSAINEAGSYSLLPTVSYPDGISNSDIIIINRNPNRITLEVAEYADKTVPVQVSYSGTLGEGMTMDISSAVLSQDKVKVSGPREVVDQISYASIAVDYSGATASLDQSYRYTLCSADGEPVDDVSQITTDAAEIRVQVPLEYQKTITLTVDLEPGAGATADYAKIMVEPGTLTVAGSKEDLDRLSDPFPVGSIDLSAVKDSVEASFEVVLPTGLRNVSNIDHVAVNVTLHGLTTRTFTVSSAAFTYTGLPEGWSVEFVTKQLSIEVRGPAEAMRNISASDVIVTLDLANKTVGGLAAQATVEVEGSGRVGVFGQYYVNFILSDQPAPEQDATDGAG